ncbi:hypothetical protein A2T98_14445 [Nodularia spumigena CENA596]|uniref:Uncharacterized protein n=1 Tax=Nodularia spumigena CENA596 TaxID=1819295 RepID=A0A166J264_NODSP|nr:hypothetical protein A2T98_14445 [Nodularia spumigena CENA596]
MSPQLIIIAFVEKLGSFQSSVNKMTADKWLKFRIRNVGKVESKNLLGKQQQIFIWVHIT